MKGKYFKEMDAIRRKNFNAWLQMTNRRINNLNTLTGEKLCFCLGYRGRNHRIVLLQCSKTIACGIININSALDLLEERYLRGLKDEEGNYTI